MPKVSITSVRETLRRLAGLGGPPWRTALAVGLGLFIGLLPIAPFQTLLALLVAFLCRLNRVAVFAGTLVWQPFTAPFLLAAYYGVGRWLFAAFGREVPSGAAGALLAPLALGAVVVAALGGGLGYLLLYGVLARRSRRGATPDVLQGEDG